MGRQLLEDSRVSSVIKEKYLLLTFQEFIIHVYKPKILSKLMSLVWFISFCRSLPGNGSLSSVNDFAINNKIIETCQLVI